jgi:hypothetical protein
MPTSPISESGGTAARVEPQPMHATEWEVRRLLMCVTNDIREDDIAAQLKCWMQISHYALKRAFQINGGWSP